MMIMITIVVMKALRLHLSILIQISVKTGNYLKIIFHRIHSLIQYFAAQPPTMIALSIKQLFL